MQESIKICSTCKKSKPADEFSMRSRALGTRAGVCKACHKEYRKGHYQLNHNKYKRKARRWARKNRLYNVYARLKPRPEGTYPEFVKTVERLRELQDARCAICKIAESECTRHLAVDHCHTTGVVRGLLCSNCNIALGLMSEDVPRIAAMLKYASELCQTDDEIAP